MIREAIKNKFASIPEVADICSGRVFWMRNESAKDVPCIVFAIVGGEPPLDVDSCDGPTLVAATIEWFAVSEDAEQAIAIQEAAKNGMKGTWAGDGVSVQNSRFAGFLEDQYLEDGEKSAYLCGCRLELTYASS